MDVLWYTRSPVNPGDGIFKDLITNRSPVLCVVSSMGATAGGRPVKSKLLNNQCIGIKMLRSRGPGLSCWAFMCLDQRFSLSPMPRSGLIASTDRDFHTGTDDPMINPSICPTARCKHTSYQPTRAFDWRKRSFGLPSRRSFADQHSCYQSQRQEGTVRERERIERPSE